jgi:hypothetical protein
VRYHDLLAGISMEVDTRKNQNWEEDKKRNAQSIHHHHLLEQEYNMRLISWALAKRLGLFPFWSQTYIQLKKNAGFKFKFCPLIVHGFI